MAWTDGQIRHLLDQGYEAYAIHISPVAGSLPPTLLNLCSTRDLAKQFISEHYPEWRFVPYAAAMNRGELGTAYIFRGTLIRISKMSVSYGIYQWLVGSEHYKSPLVAEVLAR